MKDKQAQEAVAAAAVQQQGSQVKNKNQLYSTANECGHTHSGSLSIATEKFYLLNVSISFSRRRLGSYIISIVWWKYYT